MGLSFEIVGSNKALNAQLVRLGVAPIAGRRVRRQPEMGHMPYRWFGLLRRARTLQLNDLPVTSVAPSQAPPEDATVIQKIDASNRVRPWERMLMNEQFDAMRSHLICHGDNEGSYVASDVPAPIWDDVARMFVCGLRPLLAELDALRAALPDQENLDDVREARDILEENARIALESNGALIFC